MFDDTPQTTLAHHAFTTMVLTGIAGFIDCAGLLAVGRYTSHITGFITTFSKAVSQSSLPIAGHLILLLGTFFFGAFCASMLIEATSLVESEHNARYSLPFVLQTALLLAIAIWGVWHGEFNGWLGALHLPVVHASSTHPPIYLFTHVLCFSMGMQNSLVTRVHRSVVRTTHMTGILTDLGMETAGILSSVILSIKHPHSASSHVPLWTMLDLRVYLIHWGIILSFGVFAITGALAWKAIGYTAFVFPAIAMLILGFTSMSRLAIKSQERLWTLVTDVKLQDDDEE